MDGTQKHPPSKHKRPAIIFAGITALAVVVGVVVFLHVLVYTGTGAVL